MIHPDTELRPAGEGIGLGVFATRPIPRSTIVWAFDPLDRILPVSRVVSLAAVYRPIIATYTHCNRAADHVLCWDAARFVNHSCDPNCLMLADRFDVAIRDIAAGEQVTCDYATLNIREDEAFSCACGAADCRRQIRPSDAARLAGRWAGMGESRAARPGRRASALARVGHAGGACPGVRGKRRADGGGASPAL